MRSHPTQPDEGFDAPPTLERSGSEHRRAVTSFPFREGKAWLGCGALLAGETELQKTSLSRLKVIIEAITQSPL